jgi:hypothetical protein
VIDLTSLAPAETLPAESHSENAFLWQSEAKPLADADDPSDDDVQEIVVNAGSVDEIRLVFNARESTLADRMAGVCNSFYVTSGTAGVDGLLKAIMESGIRAAGGMPTLAPAGEVPAVRGERVYVSASTTPKRYALRVGVEQWQKQIRPFAEKVVGRVEAVGRAHAMAKLQQSADQTMRQALRYLKSGAASSGTTTGQLVRPHSPLVGPDVADLADALTQIAAMRREVQLFQEQSTEAKAALRKVGIVDSRNRPLGPALLHAAAAQDLRALLDVPSATGALARATQGYDAAVQLLAQECSLKCRAHPVLYRLWNQPVAYEVADIWNNTPAAYRLAALQGDGRLAAALATELNETVAAANSFIVELRVNPEEIWRYDTAVYAALDALQLSQGDIAWRAAEEHLETIKGELSPLSQLNLGLGIVEMLAAGAAVAPPVAAVLAVLSAGVGVAELVESALDEARKDRAFAACLDPAESLALEGGSYAGVVIGALFMIFQLRGAGRDVAKLKAIR